MRLVKRATALLPSGIPVAVPVGLIPKDVGLVVPVPVVMPVPVDEGVPVPVDEEGVPVGVEVLTNHKNKF